MDFRDAGAVDDAVDALNVSLDHLIKLVEDGGLESYGDTQLVGFLQGFERLRNRLPLIDHQVVRDAQRRNLPDTLASPPCRGYWRRPCGSPSPRRPAGSVLRRLCRSGCR